MPYAFVVLLREAQVGNEGVQVVFDAGDGRGVEPLPLGDEAFGSFPAFGLGRLAFGLNAVENSPVVALYLVLGVAGDFSGQVPAGMDSATLVQGVGETGLDRRAQPLAAVGDDEQRRAQASVF